jgi:DNA-directed RNA polymerase specialized sigma24 family protein
MAHLAVVRGLTYTGFGQVFGRWIVGTYGSAFRWSGNRVDGEDVTSWTFNKVARNLKLPELVQVVDDLVLDATIDAIAHHWNTRYGIDRLRGLSIIDAPQAPTSLDTLVEGLAAEMRLVLVLRFLRRRSPAEIGAQLGVSHRAARSLLVSALTGVANNIGLRPVEGGDTQPAQVSSFVDEIVARRRPTRFDLAPEAWPSIIAACHIQASIPGNNLPSRAFVRDLEDRAMAACNGDAYLVR